MHTRTLHMHDAWTRRESEVPALLGESEVLRAYDLTYLLPARDNLWPVACAT
jgi:hypothetical protein